MKKYEESIVLIADLIAAKNELIATMKTDLKFTNKEINEVTIRIDDTFDSVYLFDSLNLSGELIEQALTGILPLIINQVYDAAIKIVDAKIDAKTLQLKNELENP